MNAGHSRKIALRGGGTLYVVMEDVAWMQFGEDERVLMSTIADALHDYEAKGRNDSPVVLDAVDPHDGETPA